MPLKEIKVEEYTSPCPLVAKASGHVEELIEMMEAEGIRHVPVVNDAGKLVGMVSDRDVIKRFFEKFEGELLVEDIMSDFPYTATIHATLDEVAFEMSSNKYGSAVILDDDDNIYGIFTTTDALNALIEVLRGQVEG